MCFGNLRKKTTWCSEVCTKRPKKSTCGSRLTTKNYLGCWTLPFSPKKSTCGLEHVVKNRLPGPQVEFSCKLHSHKSIFDGFSFRFRTTCRIFEHFRHTRVVFFFAEILMWNIDFFFSFCQL